MPAQIHIKPAHDDRHGRVRPRGDEEQRHVLNVYIVIYIEQDGEAADAEEDGEDGKEEAMTHPVRHDGHNHGHDKGAGPGRDGP